MNLRGGRSGARPSPRAMGVQGAGLLLGWGRLAQLGALQTVPGATVEPT